MQFSRTVIPSLIILGWLVQILPAQNLYRDYVKDRMAQYSPTDHSDRGLTYRWQTGHAGFFGDCDDDRAKMYSPYIDWHCRTPDRNLILRFTSSLTTDFFRKNDRFADGAGSCVCGRCQQCRERHSSEHQRYAQSRENRPASLVAKKKSGGSFLQALNPFATQDSKKKPRTPAIDDRTPSSPRYGSQFVRQSFDRAGQTASARPTQRQNLRTSPTSIYDRTARNQRSAVDLVKRETEINAIGAGRTQVAGRRSEDTPPRFDPRFRTTSSQTWKNHQAKRLAQQRSATAAPGPGEDPQSDPQHFQFRLIGGSKYR